MPILNVKASNTASHDVMLQRGVTWFLYRSSMWADQLAGVQRQFSCTNIQPRELWTTCCN